MKKKPLVGGLLNVLIPGLVYGYLGRWGRALFVFIGAVLGLVALFILAGMLESTDPPWPDAVTQAAVLVFFYGGMFLEGVTAVRRYNQPGAAAAAGARTSGNRALVIVLIGIIVILCGLLVVVMAYSGLLDRDGEPLAGLASRPSPTSAPAATSRTADPASAAEAEVTAEPAPTVEPTLKPTATEETPSEPRAVVTHETLNIRLGPGTSYAKVGVLQQGDETKVTGRNGAGTWLAITTADGIVGWVYADYTSLDTAIESLPVAQAPPPPATATPSGPKPTLSVDEQIAKIAGGEHGTLPQPGEVGGVDAGGQAEVTILNDTPYQLTVLIGSPNARTVTVEACPGCKVYSIVGPIFCQEEGRPTQTVRLAPGTMQVVARVSDPGVTPFYGTWELKANTAYFNCFYIVSRTR
jgi:hypothetical protein